MEKKIYPTALQKKILREAKKIVMARYGKDNTILAIYLGGSIVNGKFGVYKKPVKSAASPRIGSDIDVMIVIKNRKDHLSLPDKTLGKYGIRHIGPVKELPLYTMTDNDGEDILLHKIHPIEVLVFTKDFLIGRFEGTVYWEGQDSKEFRKQAKNLVIWKEMPEIKRIKEKYSE